MSAVCVAADITTSGAACGRVCDAAVWRAGLHSGRPQLREVCQAVRTCAQDTRTWYSLERHRKQVSPLITIIMVMTTIVTVVVTTVVVITVVVTI